MITLHPAPTLLNDTWITPVDLLPAFESGDVECLFHDLALIDGSSDLLSPVAPYGAILRQGDIVTRADVDDLDPGVHLSLARLANSLRIIAPFTLTAQDMDPDFNTLYRAYYYRSCTIIAWSDISHGLTFLRESMDEDDYGGYEPEGILCNVFTSMPESNHLRVAHLDHLHRDIHKHAAILQVFGDQDIAIRGIGDPA